MYVYMQVCMCIEGSAFRGCYKWRIIASCTLACTCSFIQSWCVPRTPHTFCLFDFIIITVEAVHCTRDLWGCALHVFTLFITDATTHLYINHAQEEKCVAESSLLALKLLYDEVRGSFLIGMYVCMYVCIASRVYSWCHLSFSFVHL